MIEEILDISPISNHNNHSVGTPCVSEDQRKHAGSSDFVR